MDMGLGERKKKGDVHRWGGIGKNEKKKNGNGEGKNKGVVHRWGKLRP